VTEYGGATPEQQDSRNHSLGFARRTLKNLEYIETAYRADCDVHVVTQRVVSLLGLVAYPWEDGFDQHIESRKLQTLAEGDRPLWKICEGSAETLGDLVHHVRNAIAHRRVEFSSDSRDPRAVEIEFSDAKKKGAPPHWRARISADDLLVFCKKFVALIDNPIGQTGLLSRRSAAHTNVGNLSRETAPRKEDP